MVYFRKSTANSARGEFLAISKDENEFVGEATMVPVARPLIGHYARRWTSLLNSLRMSNWTRNYVDASGKHTKAQVLLSKHHTRTARLLRTLGHNILEGKATWGSEEFFFNGGFHYFKGYWEWTEDILSRC